MSEIGPQSVPETLYRVEDPGTLTSPPAAPGGPSDDLIEQALREHHITCVVCSDVITTSDAITISSKCYHHTCISCAVCGTHFEPSDEIFIGIEDKVLCGPCKTQNKDLVKTVETCVYCKKPLSSEAMVALGSKWHPECFVCTDCGTPLTGVFRDTAGIPYCEACWAKNFAKRCTMCSKPISEQVMTIEGKDYHVECVTCSVCSKTFDNVLDILNIDADFWHIECFKEGESETESTCSTSSALLGIYNQSLGFSATNPTQKQSNNKSSRKISTVSFVPAPRPKSVTGAQTGMDSRSSPHQNGNHSDSQTFSAEPLKSKPKSTCCVIS